MTMKASCKYAPVSSTRTVPDDDNDNNNNNNDNSIPVAKALAVNHEETSVAATVATTTVNNSVRVEPQRRQPYRTIPVRSEIPTPAFFRVCAPVAKPDNMQSTTTNGKLVVQRKWEKSEVCGLICFATFWNGFLIFWNSTAVLNGDYFMALFAILHDIAGLYMIYIIMVMLMNSTFITVEGVFLTVENRPFQCCVAKKTFDTSHVREVQCKRNVNLDSKGRIQVSYDVRLFDANRVERVLVDCLPRLEEALFIEQELENHLGLQQPSANREVIVNSVEVV